MRPEIAEIQDLVGVGVGCGMCRWKWKWKWGQRDPRWAPRYGKHSKLSCTCPSMQSRIRCDGFLWSSSGAPAPPSDQRSLSGGVRETRARAVKWLKLDPKLFHHRALIMIMTRSLCFRCLGVKSGARNAALGWRKFVYQGLVIGKFKRFEKVFLIKFNVISQNFSNLLL